MTFFILLYFLEVILVVVVNAVEKQCESCDLKILSASNSVFGFNLYNVLNNGSENLLVSPLSLNYALTALSIGTWNNTLKLLKKVLNQPIEQSEQILLSYKTFSDVLKDDRNLTIASKFFANDNIKIDNQYKILLKNFEIGIDNVNFDNPSEAKKMINEFIDEKTNHVITEVLEEGVVLLDMKIFIPIALNFKSEWLHPFPPTHTTKKKFYGLNREYDMEVMFIENEYFNYADSSEFNAQIIELPYQGNYTFNVILPKEKKGITELEKKINSKVMFNNIIKPLKKQNLNLYLPKFKFEHTLHLKEPLSQLGLTTLFSEKKGNDSDFIGMTSDIAYVSDIIQKTHINVDENGTGVSTVISTLSEKTSFSSPNPVEFDVDHPFIYVVQHKPTDSPLFIGRFTHP